MLAVLCIKGHCCTCNDGELEEKSWKAHTIEDINARSGKTNNKNKKGCRI